MHKGLSIVITVTKILYNKYRISIGQGISHATFLQFNYINFKKHCSIKQAYPQNVQVRRVAIFVGTDKIH